MLVYTWETMESNSNMRLPQFSLRVQRQRGGSSSVFRIQYTRKFSAPLMCTRRNALYWMFRQNHTLWNFYFSSRQSHKYSWMGFYEQLNHYYLKSYFMFSKNNNSPLLVFIFVEGNIKVQNSNWYPLPVDSCQLNVEMGWRVVK